MENSQERGATDVPTIINDTTLYQSGDPKTLFRNEDSSEILSRFGPPKQLLSGSTKIDKCDSVGVLCRVLYMTPGLFCPSSTPACRAGCLGHTSGHMHMAGPTRARDQRAAFYIEHRDLFLEQLKDEIASLQSTALRKDARPAIRLNGTSDLLWERLHPEIFEEFSQIQFYDYTKVRVRLSSCLPRTSRKCTWPENYHLTFSGNGSQPEHSKAILSRGGSVALVFWPELPQSWMGFPVIDGDRHDARFLDPEGTIVGLRAKGIARVDLDGFVVHLCPRCGENAGELEVVRIEETTHRSVTRRCRRCGFEHRSRWMMPHALKCKISSEEGQDHSSKPLQLRLWTGS